MNLHGLVSSAIGAVNPYIEATLRKSTGYTISENKKQIPTYSVSNGKIQAQELTTDEIKHANSLNIQGLFRKVWIQGNWAGVIRADQKGGDIFTFPQYPGKAAQDWMVFVVYEMWPDWTCVGVVLQSVGA